MARDLRPWEVSAMSIRLPWLVAPSLALGLVALANPAYAWVDVHVAGDDTRLEVSPDGSARVEHKITLRISGGPLRALDLKGIDADAVPEPDGYVVTSKEAAQGSLATATPIATEMLPPPNQKEDGQPAPYVMRIRFDTDTGFGAEGAARRPRAPSVGQGLSRGVYVVFVRYKTELFRRGLLTRDGSMARIGWTGLVWEDGFDSARATFILPPGPTEPRPEEAKPDPASEAAAPPSVLSTVRRATNRDELELLRPYAPKGESIQWAVRFDARALEVTSPRSAELPQNEAGTSPLQPSRRSSLLLLCGGALFVLYSLLVALKSREVERTSQEAGAKARPLLPLPTYARSILAGLALTGGLAAELLLPTGTIGAALVALAAALAAFRAPSWTRASALRGPGAWLPISEEEAFSRPARLRGAWLDVSTRAGKTLFFLSLLLLGASVYFAAGVSTYHAHLLAYDVVAVLALFCTGRLAELPPDPVTFAAPFLRDVARRVRKATRKAGEEVRIVPRIRVPEGSAKADELRLSVVPRAPVPGFSGIEVGVLLVPATGRTLVLPEVLTRATSETPCEELLESLVPGSKPQRGRKPNERVYLLTPRLPTAFTTAELVAKVALGLRVDRKGAESSGIRSKAKLAAAPSRSRAGEAA